MAAGLTETGGACGAEAELPGVRKDGIRVELTGQEVVIDVEHRDSGTKGRARRRARGVGGSGFRVLLPGRADPDKVTAVPADDVLAVTVPRAEPGRPGRIEVTGG